MGKAPEEKLSDVRRGIQVVIKYHCVGVPMHKKMQDLLEAIDESLSEIQSDLRD